MNQVSPVFVDALEGPPPLPSICLVMPTISWDDTFQRCAQAALTGLLPGDQALIVFDGLPPEQPAWLQQLEISVVSTGRRSGPAAARNLAARASRSELLVFVDADVELRADAIARFRSHFVVDLSLAAVFGSYDDDPAAPGLVSRFRNLLHHYTHSSQPGPAITFWAGCGAVRRAAFLGCGGFDAVAYVKPSIEDIELGLRLSDGGGRILLDPSIQGKHHKRWTLRSMLVTDICQRAIPWSRLLLQRRQLPATLNLSWGSRLSAAASFVVCASILMALAFAGLRQSAVLLLFSSLLLLVALNHRFYRLLLLRTGWLHACLGVGLHALYLVYSSVVFTCVAASDRLVRVSRYFFRSDSA